MRILFRSLVVLVAIALAAWLYGLAQARRDPVVRRATLTISDWPAGAASVRAVLISDVHFGNAAMGRTRLGRIVGQIVALKPDIVLIAGDLVAGHDAATAHRAAPQLAAALSRLHPPLGTVAVLGNHDHGTDVAAVRRALTAAGVTVLANDAVQRGPLVIGGVDDGFSFHQDSAATLAAMARLKGARLILAHTPDVVLSLRQSAELARVGKVPPQIVLAGHSHCGQIVLPWYGPLVTVINAKEHYGCGATRRGVDRLVVTGGLGTSVVPLRVGAPPDLWVLTLGPAAAPAAISRSRS